MKNSWLSVYWVAPMMAWIAAQVAKVIIATIKGGPKDLRPTFTSSGNMPSSHSAITVSLLTAIALQEGVNSAAFGIMAVVTAIVIYDALNVRRAVGEQGRALKTLAPDTPFYTAMGHKPLEVVAGSIVGLLVTLILLQIL
jgi:acid phosphatase family membrane protein YuiD